MSKSTTILKGFGENGESQVEETQEKTNFKTCREHLSGIQLNFS